METCACKGCTDRAVGCHGTCEKYAEFLAKRQAEREERWNRFSVAREQCEYIKSVHQRIERRERRSRRK